MTDKAMNEWQEREAKYLLELTKRYLDDYLKHGESEADLEDQLSWDIEQLLLRVKED